MLALPTANFSPFTISPKEKGFTAIPSKESGLFVKGDVKDMEFIKIGKIDYIVSAKNDDFIEFTRINK